MMAMTDPETMHNAHLTVMKRIEPKVLHDLELLREAVRRIDANEDEAQYDGFGARIHPHQEG
jgi:hypothetical protein